MAFRVVLMAFRVVNILDALSLANEEYVRDLLFSFGCSKNKEIEDFLHNRAIEFAKQKISITYLVFDDEDKIVAYFTLAHKLTLIPCSNLSKSMQRRLGRFAQFDLGTNVYNAPAFLIAQFGKNSKYLSENSITGKLLRDYSLDILKLVQYHIGGGVVFLECENNEKLLDFYFSNNFKSYGKRQATDGVSYCQLLCMI